MKITSLGERRDLLVPGDKEASIEMATRHFVAICHESIQQHGSFYVALSGGSTPKALFEKLTAVPFSEQIPWNKIFLFWSDERSSPPDSPDSNYRMAMDAGLEKMPIPKEHIFRMKAEENIEENAAAYEKAIRKVLGQAPFDLVVLGMGEDGHTASLFPQTEALHIDDKLVVANYIPQKETWRMTLTYPCINSARHIAIYVIGDGKKETLKEVLTSEDQFDRFPIQKIGTPSHRALWIADEAASSLLSIE